MTNRIKFLRLVQVISRKEWIAMRTSDTNKLIGTIINVKYGQVMTEVIMDIGDQAVTATITAGAASDMKLHEGDQVFAVFNPSNVALIKG